MTNNRRIVAAKSSSPKLRTERQNISTGMNTYAAPLEHKIEQLNNFRTWAIDKIGMQEIVTLVLRPELEQLWETVLSENYVQRRSSEDEKIASPVTPVSIPVMGGRIGCSESGQTKRTVRFDDDATKNGGCKKKSGGFGSGVPSANERPCTFPTKPGNFDLSFDETATQ